ncbi:MAG TPA: proteasome assembly chaperone 4 [Nitrosopumilaceae archaeon]|nr:proteasome assembly chaperone 4 [Nitrosopumilaceae archaeon]
MNSPKGFSEKTIELGGRSFFLQILKFENGYFVSITEGSSKLGSMVVSLSTGQNPVTTTVIPSKSDSLFLKLVAETISARTRGIAIVSTYVQKELDADTAKVLMTEIIEIIQN